MTIQRISLLPTSLAIVSLALLGPACVGFISSDDGADDNGETAGTEDDAGDGDQGDGDQGDGDGDQGDGDGDTGPSECVSIFDVQQGMVAEDQVVCVEGAVVTTPVNAEDGLVFVQDPAGGEYSGVSLYLYSEVVEGVPLAPGDTVNLTGRYAEFFDMSQLVIENVGDIEVTGNEDPPAGDVVEASAVARTNADAEPWEGVYVCINDATILEGNDGFGQYLLVGDALVGNAFVGSLPEAQIGGSFAQVCGALHYSFEEFKLQPPNEAALDGYVGPDASTATIPEIQQGMVGEGSLVSIENVIVTSGYTWSDDVDASFFVQDPGGGPWSGIEVYLADTTGLDLAPGDDITLVGVYDEFFDMSQISVADASMIMVNGSGPAPAPEVIADPATIATDGAMAEEYEGVLVRVEDVTVLSDNPDDPDDFGEFTVDGDLRVDDVFFDQDDWTKPMVGQGYASITGPLVYAFSNFKLEPRDAGDLVQN